jgi:hypothetical protein
VCGGIEQQLAGGDHPFQHTNGVDDRPDCHSGHVAFHAAGKMVAVFVDRGFVFAAADQVSPRNAIRIAFGVGATARSQAEDYWWRGVIPTVRYSFTAASSSGVWASGMRV